MILLKSFSFPLEIVSPNRPMHWSKRSALNKKHRNIITWQFKAESANFELPVTVRLIRTAPREYDYDNLVSAFKNIRDVCADILIPGLARGQADSSELIKWEYAQEKGKKGIRIEILKD